MEQNYFESLKEILKVIQNAKGLRILFRFIKKQNKPTHKHTTQANLLNSSGS